MTERVRQNVSQILRSVVQKDWVKRCPMMEFAINSTVSTITEHALFEINYRWIPTMISTPKWDDIPLQGVWQYAEHALATIDAVHDAIMASCVIQTHQANRHRRPEPTLKVGDLTYLSTKELNLPKGRARKLLPKFIGPYRIRKALLETSNYELELPPELTKRRIHKHFHISRLRPHVKNEGNRFPHRDVITYYDFGTDPETEWFVDEIIGHRWAGKQLSLQVK
jgi:hypothetical protein